MSGRGVGMDVVRTRITELNGTIEVQSTPQEGTTFTLRLPLTLAIINCLLVQMRGVTFSMPIDDVREIVSVRQRDIITVNQKRTIDVRDEFIPLCDIDDIFEWHGVDYGYDHDLAVDEDSESVEVVIVSASGKDSWFASRPTSRQSRYCDQIAFLITSLTFAVFRVPVFWGTAACV